MQAYNYTDNLLHFLRTSPPTHLTRTPPTPAKNHYLNSRLVILYASELATEIFNELQSPRCTFAISIATAKLPAWSRHVLLLRRGPGVRQDHVRAVIADSALLSSMEMYAFLLRPGLAALDNLADKFVAGWLLPSKVLDLSYLTPPLPLLVFAIQSDEGITIGWQEYCFKKMLPWPRQHSYHS